MKKTTRFILCLLVIGHAIQAQPPAIMPLFNSTTTGSPAIANTTMGNLLISSTTSTAKITMDSGANYLVFQNGIQINVKTGAVKLPDGMKIDDASRKFWISLAESFPGVRDAWVSGYFAGKARP